MPWIRVPIREPLTIHSLFEHTPLDYYRYGAYPRFIRRVGAHHRQDSWKWEWREDSPSTVKPKQGEPR